ncbi:MAG: large conductance mechanosensitive channel protein MscL, partial [Gemmatimonadetes bacterium]|nr:large conductance mechanosensitive channel protein MscL [Gemmatimonadota bacterium]
SIIVFLIVAFAVFLLVRGYNRLREAQESVPAAPTDKECPFCRFTIPLGATRCAHCTSELPAAGPA